MAKRSTRTGREIIIRAVRNVLLGAVLVVAASYLVDYAVLRFRISANENPYGSVAVQPVYAVPKKNHSTEFLVGDVQNQTCVNSLFPHMNHSPCWYLQRHKEQQVDM